MIFDENHQKLCVFRNPLSDVVVLEAYLSSPRKCQATISYEEVLLPHPIWGFVLEKRCPNHDPDRSQAMPAYISLFGAPAITATAPAKNLHYNSMISRISLPQT
jgi:hypothetical protein